jgi:membrane protease YdiL (CAAX protease family)
VFRRGLFRSVYGRFQKWGLTGGKLFWAAAAASGLLFSGAHYVDFGLLLARVGIGDAAAASGLGGVYAFTLGGFLSRAVLGAALAWLYAESGVLLLPILAHFFADSLEGLGLHWGFAPLLAMAAGALLVQRAWNKGRTQRS